jgi:hypothetical protein
MRRKNRPQREWRCPLCGEEAPRSLVPCGGCDWSDRVLAGRARRLLRGFSLRGSEHAYQPGGCRVCPACCEQFGRNMRSCPLRLIARCALERRRLPFLKRPGLVLQVATRFRKALEERGHPEQVEIYWRRWLAWVTSVQNQR